MCHKCDSIYTKKWLEQNNRTTENSPGKRQKKRFTEQARAKGNYDILRI